jgi:methionine sulfoxide reductase heme-binding subunit
MQDDPTFWLLARASGITAYLLLAAAVVAGLTLSGRPLGKRLKPAVVTDIHRTLSLSAILVTAVHGIALWADHTIEVSLAALVVPGLVDHRPVWTAMGVLAGNLMLVVHVSFRFRRRIGVQRWRRLHYVTFAVFGFATMHGALAGSDSGTPWAQWAYIACATLVCGLTVWRATAARKPKRPRAPARPASPSATHGAGA